MDLLTAALVTLATPQEAPEPATAATISALSAPAFALGAGLVLARIGQIENPSFVGGMPTLVALALAPALVGAGQFYAGDRQRAAWVSGGSTLVVWGATAGSFAYFGSLSGERDRLTGAVLKSALVYVVTAGACCTWSAFDAYSLTSGTPSATPRGSAKSP